MSREPWNKDRQVGARKALSLSEIAKIRRYLSSKETSHDLCLFAVAVDTMLRASDLLGWQNDRSGTTKTLRRLGLEDKKGNPNMEAIKAFGDYTKENYASGVIELKHLLEHFGKLIF